MSDHPTLPFEAAEQWLPVVGFEGAYEVSDLGRVRLIRRPHGRFHGRPTKDPSGILHPSVDRDYLVVGLTLNGRLYMRRVHRLVALAFHGEQPRGCEVRHLDGNARNNAASNLAWGTRSENIQDMLRHGTHHLAKRTHCDEGHEFTPENTLIRENGARRCKTCRQVASQRHWATRKALRAAQKAARDTA